MYLSETSKGLGSPSSIAEVCLDFQGVIVECNGLAVLLSSRMHLSKTRKNKGAPLFVAYVGVDL